MIRKSLKAWIQNNLCNFLRGVGILAVERCAPNDPRNGIGIGKSTNAA